MSKKAERTRSRTRAKDRGPQPRSSRPERGLNTTVETRELLECLRLLDDVHASQTRAERVLLYQTRTAILERIGELHGLRTDQLTRAEKIRVTFSLGFDRLVMPSPAQFDALKAANDSLAWCGYYLAPTPQHKDTSWLGNRLNLLANGWSPVPIYLPTPPATVQNPSGAGSAEATVEGHKAANLTAAEGFPSGTYTYLDIEAGDAFDDTGSAYIATWVQEVIAVGFQPGIYCSHVLATQVTKILDGIDPTPNARLWVFKVKTTAKHPLKPDLPQRVASSPTGAAPNATMWQFEQNAVIDDPSSVLEGLDIDLSTSAVQDPSEASVMNEKSEPLSF